jgi:hypothetical protein
MSANSSMRTQVSTTTGQGGWILRWDGSPRLTLMRVGSPIQSVCTGTFTPIKGDSPVDGLSIHVSGNMPLHPLWDIDAELRLKWKKNPGGGVCFDGDLVGDAFPNAEVFAMGAGKNTMLHTFGTERGPAIGPTVVLTGENQRQMGSLSKCD